MCLKLDRNADPCGCQLHGRACCMDGSCVLFACQEEVIWNDDFITEYIGICVKCMIMNTEQMHSIFTSWQYVAFHAATFLCQEKVAMTQQ